MLLWFVDTEGCSFSGPSSQDKVAEIGMTWPELKMFPPESTALYDSNIFKQGTTGIINAIELGILRDVLWLGAQTTSSTAILSGLISVPIFTQHFSTMMGESQFQ